MPVSIKLKYHVYMEDGTEYDVIVHQREIARFEAQPFGVSFAKALEEGVFTLMRWTAWKVLWDRRDYKGSWDVFDQECLEVTDFMPDGPEIGVDPTRSEASAEDSSSSRSSSRTKGSSRSRSGT